MVYKKIEENDYIKNYKLKDLQKEDIPKLVFLFKQIFKKEWDQNYWNWFLYQSPYSSHALSLWDGDELIGFNCGLKRIISVNGKVFDCILVSTALVNENYRRQGIYSYIVKNLYNELYKFGYLLIYGFPNENYDCRLYSKQKLAWDYCHVKTILYKDLKEISQKELDITSNDFSIVKVEVFTKKVNDLSLNKKQGIFLMKFYEYLNWRYIKHPKNNYNCFIIYDKESNVVGFFISKTYIDTQNTKFGEIDDFLFLYENEVLFSRFYQYILKYYKAMEQDYISLWTGKKSKFYRFLIKNGFKENQMKTSWGIKLLDLHKSKKLKKELMTIENWNLKMGDSDVF